MAGTAIGAVQAFDFRYGVTQLTAARAHPAPAEGAQANPVMHNSKEVMAWYRSGDHEAMTLHFLKVLSYLNKHHMTALSPEAQYFVDTFVRDFLYYMTQTDFRIDDQFVKPMIQSNPVIANVVAMTPLRNTDAALRILMDRRQTGNLVKILALYNAFNEFVIDPKVFFDAHPGMACLWYSMFYGIYTSALASPIGLKNFRRHMTFDHPGLKEFHHFQDVYFGATYADCDNDWIIKRRVNESLQRKFENVTFKHKPRPPGAKPRVAVFSDLWHARHSVYRTLSGYIEALKDDFHLTFVHSEFEDASRFATEMFDDIIYLGRPDGGLDLSLILENDFAVAYFPDIGMTKSSIILANLRIAPVMMMGTGHPVSTHGSLVDYFVTGADVEDVQRARDNYSEKLLVLPGNGSINNPIDYQLRHPKLATDRVIINCPWSSQKVNYEMLLTMKKIKEQARNPVEFRIFPGGSSGRFNGHVAFTSAVEDVLGRESVKVYPGLDYETYMATMEEGHLTIEAYPFGGSNTVADSVHLGKPTITWQGRYWYNRIGSRLLRAVRLKKCVATDEDEFVCLVLRMVNDLRIVHALSSTLAREAGFERLSDSRGAAELIEAIRRHAQA